MPVQVRVSPVEHQTNACTAEQEAWDNYSNGASSPMCHEKANGSEWWRCHRRAGHEGVHVACNAWGNRVRWPWIPR